MKKITLFLLACSGALFAQNQGFTVTGLDMVPYENNSVQVFNERSEWGVEPLNPNSKLHIVVNNVSDEPINVVGQIVEMTNTDGNLAQFCIGGMFGSCFYPLFEGAFYPNAGFPLQPGTYQSLEDYLVNMDPNPLVEYKLRFMELDDAGNEIPDTSFNLTYRYDEAMSVSDVNSIAIAQVAPTLVKGQTNVTLKENASVQVLNMQGKSVKSLKMNSGSSQLDLSGLSAGTYVIQFKGESGKTTTTKVVVK